MIFIAGHKGLVGSSILQLLKKQKKKIIIKDKKYLNLENYYDVDQFFKKNRIKKVFLCAAKVGGIYANNTYPYDFINKNILIQNNIINSCLKYKVKQLILLGSSCIYPKLCPQPIKEEYLLSGKLEFTNRPYAIAKISGIEQIWACNRQHKTKYFALMPTNLYGPNDNFDPLNSHVIPGIIRKILEAKLKKKKKVILWGTGKPKREFLYSHDLAKIAVKLSDTKKLDKIIFNKNMPPLLNIGSGQELSIKDLSKKISKIINFNGRIYFDPKYPDGTPRKILDLKKLKKIVNLNEFVKLDVGLEITIKHFLKNSNIA